MTTSFDFNLKNVNGSAVIVEFSSDVLNTATEAFESDGDLRIVTVNKIGLSEGPTQPGYLTFYDIYETYTDSGSDDYYYFATANYCEEI